MTAKTAPASASALEAFQSVDFNSTRQLRSIWREYPYEISALHARCAQEILVYFDKATREIEPVEEPRGCVVVGPAGHGKTHLIGRLRRKIWEREGWFVLLDLVGVKDFWSSVALSFLNALQAHRTSSETQNDLLVFKLAGFLNIHDDVGRIVDDGAKSPRVVMAEMTKLFRDQLWQRFRHLEPAQLDVLAAVIFLMSGDLDQRNLAHSWLQGMALDPQDLRAMGVSAGNSPVTVVRCLCWLMSLVGPILIAVDQIDAIMSAANAQSRVAQQGEADAASELGAVVEQLSQGLIDLYDVKRRAVVVISCLEATWEVIKSRSTAAVGARFREEVALSALPDSERAAAIVEARIAPAYAAVGYTPPYPTWPFRAEAFTTAVGLAPRELLRACERHQVACARAGQITERFQFGDESVPVPPPPPMSDLDARYAQALETAHVAGLLDPPHEDDLRKLFAHALGLFSRQFDLPENVDSDVQFYTGQKTPPLHGRLSFTFRAEGEREQHYCFRLLGHANHLAFQSRIKAAMTASGIGTRLGGRHLILLRASEPPKGPKSQQLAAEFLKAGGRFIAPADADLRAFVALRALAGAPDFAVWLRQRKPLFDAPLFVAAGLCPPPFLAATTPDPQPPAPSPAVPGAPVSPPDGGPPAPPSPEPQRPASPAGAVPDIVVGHRAGPAGAGDPVGLAPSLLPRHVAVFAGSGSGKTVLLRRLVEEAALRGMPAIVLDINNDLARLGDPWPAPPEGFTAEDARKAARYRAAVEVVVWTPGIASGNPLSLDLLPDFSAIGDGRDPESEDERAQAVDMARATLDPYVAGGGQKANERRGVLADALRLFARRGGGTLRQLVDLLAELPEGASEIGNAGKLAEAMANQLRAAIATNPLLRSGGPGLDPQLLFHGPDPERTRISVLNLSGLASEDAREAFVNQLQMTLFTWLKQHPSPTGRLYVLDEAQNFAPSQAMTACKASTRALAAQARKYGLGMVFATQLPRGIDNGIVSNCTTHLYGRMSAPATIQATRELMAAKGGDADDLARLGRGVFYFSTEGLARPVKIRTPLCLSHHPANPPTAEDVVARARASRRPPA